MPRSVTSVSNCTSFGLLRGDTIQPCWMRAAPTIVLVVQPTDKRMRRNVSGALNRSGYRGIFVQGTMGPRLIVIASV